MRIHIHLLASLAGFARSAHPVLAARGAALDVLSSGRQLGASCGPKGFVKCVDGYVADSNGDPTIQRCAAACGGECCVGEINPGAPDLDIVDPCNAFTGTICRDGSCSGFNACSGRGSNGQFLDGLIGGSDGTATGPSCVGHRVCQGDGNTGSITGGSCVGSSACLSLGGQGTVGSISDGSCVGDRVCSDLGTLGGTVGSISGGSCVGFEACRGLGREGTVGSISDGSCDGSSACRGVGNSGGTVESISGSCHGEMACTWLGEGSLGNISPINDCCQSGGECHKDQTDADLPANCGYTAEPTGSPTTAAPTSTPWTIDFIGIVSDFSSSSGDEVVMTYEIGKNRTHEAFLYEGDCASSIKDLTVNTTEVKTNINGTHDLLTLRHSVDKSAIANSTTWDPATNKFKFCQFVRLIVPETIGQLEMEIATDYHEVVIDFDLSADFAIENELGAGTIEEAAGETNVSSYVDACKCNGPDNFTCEPDALVPNTQLHVCIKSVSTDIQVKELKSMVVVQGDSVLNVILGGLVQLSSIASMTYVKAQNGVVVSTFVPTNMFNYSAGTSINITGGIDMELAGSRRLLARVLDGDTLGADGDDQEFELKVDLKEEVLVLEGEGGWTDSSGAVLGGASALLGVALLIAYGLW